MALLPVVVVVVVYCLGRRAWKHELGARRVWCTFGYWHQAFRVLSFNILAGEGFLVKSIKHH